MTKAKCINYMKDDIEICTVPDIEYMNVIPAYHKRFLSVGPQTRKNRNQELYDHLRSLTIFSITVTTNF